MGARFRFTYSFSQWPAGCRICIFAAAFWAAIGCDFVDEEGPGVLAVEVIPSSITIEEIESAPTEYFEIEISTVNFDDEIQDANAFIGDQDRDALPPGEVVVDGTVVYLEGILNHWFQGYEPGLYEIGVLVESETAFTRELNWATVEVVANDGS